MNYAPLNVMSKKDENNENRFRMKEGNVLAYTLGNKEGRKKEMKENRPKNMPLPDKPRPHHRSPICGKLSS